MKKQILYTLLLTTSLSMIAGCEKPTDKITLNIGFWPENTETRDVAMYNEWKEAFEKDYHDLPPK